MYDDEIIFNSLKSYNIFINECINIYNRIAAKKKKETRLY